MSPPSRLPFYDPVSNVYWGYKSSALMSTFVIMLNIFLFLFIYIATRRKNGHHRRTKSSEIEVREKRQTRNNNKTFDNRILTRFISSTIYQ